MVKYVHPYLKARGERLISSFLQEAIKNEIDLSEDDPKLVKLMIDYLYTLDYKAITPIPETPASNDQETGQSIREFDLD